MFHLFEDENLKSMEQENFIRKVATQEDLPGSSTLLTKTKRGYGKSTKGTKGKNAITCKNKALKSIHTKDE